MELKGKSEERNEVPIELSSIITDIAWRAVRIMELKADKAASLVESWVSIRLTKRDSERSVVVSSLESIAGRRSGWQDCVSWAERRQPWTWIIFKSKSARS